MDLGLAEVAIVLLILVVLVAGPVLFVLAFLAGQRRRERDHGPTP